MDSRGPPKVVEGVFFYVVISNDNHLTISNGHYPPPPLCNHHRWTVGGPPKGVEGLSLNTVIQNDKPRHPVVISNDNPLTISNGQLVNSMDRLRCHSE